MLNRLFIRQLSPWTGWFSALGLLHERVESALLHRGGRLGLATAMVDSGVEECVVLRACSWVRKRLLSIVSSPSVPWIHV